MSRMLAAAPFAMLAFVCALALAAIAVHHGFVTGDALRLWAGASTAADGEVPIGRIVAAYPTLPFLSTTLVAWLAPAETPAAALVAAALFAGVVAFCLLSLRSAGWPPVATFIITVLIASHPALLRAVVAGPADMFFALFLLMLCLALYDLRARSGTSEVMAVGLALMGLAFSHPIGAAFAFASVPFLAIAVRPVLVASSAYNVVVALIFPTLFAVAAFAYVSWIFPGDGWSFFAAPAESLARWKVDVARVFGDGFSGIAALDGSLAMAAALAIGAPVAAYMVVLVRRRRPLLIPALVFAAAALAATALIIIGGFFGDPASILVAAPVLAAAALIRVPAARERTAVALMLLVLGWFGGCASLTFADPIAIGYLHGTTDRAAGERADALAAGGAAAGYDGVLADVENAPAFLLGRGRARGIFGPQSETFSLALLFARVEASLIAVPDPQSEAGAADRLDRAFPSLYRAGLRGYGLVYRNNTWKLFARLPRSVSENNNAAPLR